MKKIVLLLSASFVFTSPSFAAKGERMEARKAQMTAHLDKKIAQLNEHKSCISAATGKDSMKACKKAHKQKMKDLKSEMKSARSAMRAKFKSK